MFKNLTQYPKISHVLGLTLGIAAGMLTVGWGTPINAQDFSGNASGVFSGIFYPRSSEEFFQEGRERLDEEILFLRGINTATHRPELTTDEAAIAPSDDTAPEADGLIIIPPDEEEQEPTYYLR